MDVDSKENLNRGLFFCVYNTVVQSSCKVETRGHLKHTHPYHSTTWVFINEPMVKQNIILQCAHAMEYYSALKEGNSNTYYMAEPSWHYTKWNKSLTNEHMNDMNMNDLLI